ncbi:transmembrane and coiled-coil domain-containing protein 5B [Macaca mulatta]
MMEDVGQHPLDDVYQMMELPSLEAVKQNLDCLNSDLEKDLQKLDMENQVLLRKIKEKEETIPRKKVMQSSAGMWWSFRKRFQSYLQILTLKKKPQSRSWRK